MAPTIDVSRDAQLRDIEASFAACNDSFDLSALHHPTKPGVTAVESYEVLPDADIWANQYDLFKFSERPGERLVDVCFIVLFAKLCLHVLPIRWTILVLIVPYSDP